METASVVQTAISGMTAVKIITALLVYHCNYSVVKCMKWYLQLCTDPRTCADVGITQCCVDRNGTGHCDVHFRDSDNTRCSCNASCHERNNCCPDALMFCERKSNNIIIQAGGLAPLAPCCTWLLNFWHLGTHKVGDSYMHTLHVEDSLCTILNWCITLCHYWVHGYRPEC
jgi:hypothetical protein